VVRAGEDLVPAGLAEVGDVGRPRRGGRLAGLGRAAGLVGLGGSGEGQRGRHDAGGRHEREATEPPHGGAGPHRAAFRVPTAGSGPSGPYRKLTRAPSWARLSAGSTTVALARSGASTARPTGVPSTTTTSGMSRSWKCPETVSRGTSATGACAAARRTGRLSRTRSTRTPG